MADNFKIGSRRLNIKLPIKNPKRIPIIAKNILCPFPFLNL